MADEFKRCPKCAEEVRAEAKVCRHCGHEFGGPATTNEPARSGFAKKAGIGCLGILGLLFVIGILAGPNPETSPQSQGTTGEDAVETTTGSDDAFTLKKITADEYASLREGMTYAQAVAIVGDPGEELSSSNVGGISTVMYSWANFDGSNANAMFQDGRLVMKAQYGL